MHMQGGVHRLTALKLCLKYSFHPTSLEDIFEFQNTLGCRPKVEKHEGPNKVPHFFFIIPFVMAHGGDNVAEIRAHEVMLGIAHQRRRASKCCDPEGVVLGLKRWCWLPTSFRDRVINFTLRALSVCCKRVCGPKAMKAALAMDSGSADAGWYQRLRKQKALYEERGRRVRLKLFLQSSIESILRILVVEYRISISRVTSLHIHEYDFLIFFHCRSATRMGTPLWRTATSTSRSSRSLSQGLHGATLWSRCRLRTTVCARCLM